jgi:hypothetical protein
MDEMALRMRPLQRVVQRPFQTGESGMKVLSSCRAEGVFTDWRLR